MGGMDRVPARYIWALTGQQKQAAYHAGEQDAVELLANEGINPDRGWILGRELTPTPTAGTIDNSTDQDLVEMSFDEAQGQFTHGVDGAAGEGFSGATQVSGARITDPYSSRADAHADRYYGLVRNMKTDVARIAKNTGYPVEVIQQIKDFLFVEEHDLGELGIRCFYPDFAIAQSWQRLIAGTPETHDLTLLRHELMERQLMLSGMSQDDAHLLASRKYNYTKEVREFYGSISKHSD